MSFPDERGRFEMAFSKTIAILFQHVYAREPDPGIDIFYFLKCNKNSLKSIY
jgi:hypothetical protein